MKTFDNTVSKQAMEAEWLEIQAAQQEPALFQPLYNRYYEAIFRFIFRRVNDENLSAEITSQVFLKAMQKLSKYQFRGVPFSAWLYRIASNEVTQYFRNSSKRRTVSLEDYQLSNIAEEIATTDNEALKKTMIDALQMLKPDHLTLIELRFFEQRPFKEIADILDLTESNAKVKTYRVLEQLKKIILKNSKNLGYE